MRVGTSLPANLLFRLLRQIFRKKLVKIDVLTLEDPLTKFGCMDGRAADWEVDGLVEGPASRSSPIGGPRRSSHPGGGGTWLALALWRSADLALALLSAEDEIGGGDVQRRRISSRTVEEIRAANSSETG